jgi:hypothetical protein
MVVEKALPKSVVNAPSVPEVIIALWCMRSMSRDIVVTDMLRVYASIIYYFIARLVEGNVLASEYRTPWRVGYQDFDLNIFSFMSMVI